MKLGYVLLYVDDVLASVDFYERAFGLSRRMVAPAEPGQAPDYAEMHTGETALGFVSHTLARSNGVPYAAAKPGDPAAPAEVALVTEDVAEAFTRATEAGAEPVLSPTIKPWGQTVSYVRDPDGFLVELCSPMG